MPKQIFDTTALQQKIDEYIREMEDIFTKGAETERYAKFCEAIFRIKALTDYYYLPDSKGKLAPVDHKARLELVKAYNEAIGDPEKEVREMLTGQESRFMKRWLRYCIIRAS